MFRGAMLPAGSGNGQDRWSAVSNAAIVLDGASSFAPESADASAYVDSLIGELTGALRYRSTAELTDILADAIRNTVRRLYITPGYGPSSTVLIAVHSDTTFDILALGDSTALVKATDGTVHRIVDTRLSRTASQLRKAYRDRLKGGSGYDAQHATLLRHLQQQERTARNSKHGYWIAEVKPEAAYEALRRSFPVHSVEWCVLATDGAQHVIDYLGEDWDKIAQMSNTELQALLVRLRDWESFEDPTGKLLPRPKKHDDKTLVVWSPNTA